MPLFVDTQDIKHKKLFDGTIIVNRVFYDTTEIPLTPNIDQTVYDGAPTNYIEMPYNFFDVFSNVQIRLVESNGMFITGATVYNEGLHMVMGGMIEFIVSGNYIMSATSGVYFDWIYGELK